MVYAARKIKRKLENKKVHFNQSIKQLHSTGRTVDKYGKGKTEDTI